MNLILLLFFITILFDLEKIKRLVVLYSLSLFNAVNGKRTKSMRKIPDIIFQFTIAHKCLQNDFLFE